MDGEHEEDEEDDDEDGRCGGEHRSAVELQSNGD
jgi:hypothetical protein